MSNTHFKKIKAGVANMELFEQPLVTDRVNIVTLTMKEIPAKSNPFCHDLTSMGAHITDNFTAMYTNSFQGKHGQMYLVNNATGQRTRMVFIPEAPRPKKIIRITGEHIGNNLFHKIGYTLVDPSVDIAYTDRYVSYKALADIQDFAKPPATGLDEFTQAYGLVNINEQPVYWVSNGLGILYYPGVTNDLNDLIQYTLGDYVEDSNLLMAFNSMVDNFKATGFEQSPAA